MKKILYEDEIMALYKHTLLYELFLVLHIHNSEDQDNYHVHFLQAGI